MGLPCRLLRLFSRLTRRQRFDRLPMAADGAGKFRSSSFFRGLFGGGLFGGTFGWFRRSLCLGRRRTPENDQFAQVLHWRAGQPVADGELQRFAFGAVIVENAHFDEFVGIQGVVDFAQHGRRQAVLTDHDDGGKRMRLGAQGAAFDGG